MNEATTLMTFWDTFKDGKISIHNYNFKLFLEGNNFIKSKPNPQSTFNLIRKNGIFLNIVDEYEIKDFVMDFILQHNFESSVFNLVKRQCRNLLFVLQEWGFRNYKKQS
jgi:hypothetical protein